MVIRDHIRSDGSIRHIVEHDVKSGAVLKVHGVQGYNSESCWTRGSAWAIYGMMLSFIHTGEKRYYDTAVKAADYFIENVKKKNYIVTVDFFAPDEPIYYDTTAAACAACGISEIAKCSPENEKRSYYDTEVSLLQVLDEKFCDYGVTKDSILQMGTERYPHESMNGVHIPIIYGDFFYFEALLKLKNNEFQIW